MEERSEKSVGERTTMRAEEASEDRRRADAERAMAGEHERVAERAAQRVREEEGEGLSEGERATQGAGWRTAEEWQGKRWKAGEEILGRYVVEGELGQGGMGVVYKCLDKVGGVRVAVKALPPELSHNSAEMEEVRENFELVVGLRHPNIAGVRMLEKDGRGEYFLVMDVAEGVSLRKWLRERRRETGDGWSGVPLDEAFPILRQVAAALDYAHGEKVIHRDVKPGNVMIDGWGRVKVLDFGLAAQIRTSMSRASQAYRGTSGTGPYMAPEQWEGKPQGAKTDQYALAVMAYEMLAGHLPFENVNWQVLKEAVLHGDIASIPGAPWRAMEALQRGLSKNGEERYRSCGEFVAALRGRNTVKISPRATNAPTGGTTPAASKGKEKKKRAGWGWLAALALAVGLGAGAWWWQGRTTTASQEAADTESLEVAPSGPAGEEPFESPREEEVDDSLQGIQLQEELPSGIRHQMEEIQRRVEEAERRLEEERAAAEKTRHELEEWLARMKQQQEPTARERNTEEEKNPVQTPPLGEERRAGEERVFTLPGGARMVMVWCPAGSFMMGESGRQHPVTLTHGFWLAKHEVTQAQWKSVMGRGNNPSHFKGDDLPVESVTSDYLRDFCRKAGLRLPTEAEWEYACRAGSTTEYFWGNTLNGDKANCDGNSPYGTWMKGTNLGKTTQGGKYPANRWGFCDMHGNVWERCADWYGDYPAGAVTNPTGPFSGSARVYRGGSWDSSAGDCRSAKRGRNPPSGSAGFRPARTPL